jgi:tetratricopeptide (TPR) repeat protein
MRLALLALACLVLPAQTQDPAYDPLQKAYQSLREKKYLDAIDHLLLAVKAAPERASIRKELGYAYLKVGETDSARELFEHAVTLDPADWRAALELAFLSHETGREARALELLELVRRTGDAEAKRAAEEAFTRIDSALGQAVERWTAAVEQDPANRAARLELARNLDKRRQPARAAEQYLAAWRLPPRREEILLDLARAREEAGDREGAAGAWLLASRSGETRVAERARGRLPRRAPFANEYRRGLELDPAHTGLRRDLAFLWLAVNRKDDAIPELEIVVRQDPNDMLAAAQLGFLYLDRKQPDRAVPLLERVAQGSDAELAQRARQALGKKQTSQATPHKALGEKSLAASYLKDALREFQIAHEIDPDDYEVALKLGVVHNILREDREALKWFARAMRSPDAAVAAEARRSYRNLAPQLRRFQTSIWTLPFYSTRYHDTFHYAQLKTELRLGSLPVRPYVSLRLSGDWKRKTAGPLPQFLSESSLIASVGARTLAWRGLTAWAEAGQAASYLSRPPPGTPRFGPDYRGGIAWFRNLGASLGGDRAGPFAEFNADLVYLSRFRHDLISYWQTRPGYRLPQLGWFRSQVFWNANVTGDRRREYWANFAEFGPGFRFRVPRVSPPLDVTISGLRGVYLINESNPYGPNYYDLRVGLWYSAAR